MQQVVPKEMQLLDGNKRGHIATSSKVAIILKTKNIAEYILLRYTTTIFDSKDLES